jgi:hypothetical protein
MTDNLRALFVIAIIALVVFTVAKPAFSGILSPSVFQRQRGLWLTLTLVLFLAHDFWLYVFAAAAIVFNAQRSAPNKLSIYLMLLFVAPAYSAKISGLGLFNFLFEVDYIRLLSLVILFPLFIRILDERNQPNFGRTVPDKFLLIFMLLLTFMELREGEFTVLMRRIFYNFTDIFLPYFVASRGFRNVSQFRECLSTYLLACLLLAGVAIFEYSKTWLLYAGLADGLGIDSGGLFLYLERSSSLRALASTGQPIVLGYLLMIAIGCFYYLRPHLLRKELTLIILVTLFAGLLATSSRGPWIGCYILLFTLALLNKKPLLQVGKFFVWSVVLFCLALVLPAGDKIINILPWIGHSEGETLDYREQLLTSSLAVVEKNPWFGSMDYMSSPELARMVQGQGIIDIVNSYVQVLLQYGYVGLFLYCGFFVSILYSLAQILYGFKEKNDLHVLGCTFFSILIGILITIYTVSSISFIPSVYWIFAGMATAYVNLVRVNDKLLRSEI